MTRACMDVFAGVGKPLVPMSGESNNGFMRIWKDAGLKSAGPIFTPGLGPALIPCSRGPTGRQADVEGI